MADVAQLRLARDYSVDARDCAQIFIDGPQVMVIHVLEIEPRHDLEKRTVEGRRNAMGTEGAGTSGMPVIPVCAMPHDLDLSNPSTFTTLPFPSLLQMPSQRFETKDINDVDHFEYMGRTPFRELQQRTQNVNFLKGSESLYLYGTSGLGKSHLLAALAYNLVREGSRVFYIPDCSTLLLEPAKTMWTALNFALYDSAVLGTIGNPRDVEELIELMSGHSDLYIIVDQVNALDIVADNDSRKAKKVQALNWLDALRFNHRYVFSASANEASNREADRKQSGLLVF